MYHDFLNRYLLKDDLKNRDTHSIISNNSEPHA